MKQPRTVGEQRSDGTTQHRTSRGSIVRSRPDARYAGRSTAALACAWLEDQSILSIHVRYLRRMGGRCFRLTTAHGPWDTTQRHRPDAGSAHRMVLLEPKGRLTGLDSLGSSRSCESRSFAMAALGQEPACLAARYAR